MPAPEFGPLPSAGATWPAGPRVDPRPPTSPGCSVPGSAGAVTEGWSSFLASSNRRKDGVLSYSHKTVGIAWGLLLYVFVTFKKLMFQISVLIKKNDTVVTKTKYLFSATWSVFVSYLHRHYLTSSNVPESNI